MVFNALKIKCLRFPMRIQTEKKKKKLIFKLSARVWWSSSKLKSVRLKKNNLIKRFLISKECTCISVHSIFFLDDMFLTLTVFVYFNYPPPLELKKKFSDESPRFEFEWVISGQICKIDLALKSKVVRENLRFSKTFQTGLGASP